MKIRIVGIVFGVLAVLGAGAAPASAAPAGCLPPVIYPWCG